MLCGKESASNNCQYRLHEQTGLAMWNDTEEPLAYFITFRTYGTWLHGDERGSTDRSNNVYGEPFIAPSTEWERYNRRSLRSEPFILNAACRNVVEKAIREVCEHYFSGGDKRAFQSCSFSSSMFRRLLSTSVASVQNLLNTTPQGKRILERNSQPVGG